jgi:hypothetical protein
MKSLQSGCAERQKVQRDKIPPTCELPMATLLKGEQQNVREKVTTFTHCITTYIHIHSFVGNFVIISY